MTATRVALFRSVPDGDHLGVEAIASPACYGYGTNMITFPLDEPHARPSTRSRRRDPHTVSNRPAPRPGSTGDAVSPPTGVGAPPLHRPQFPSTVTRSSEHCDLPGPEGIPHV